MDYRDEDNKKSVFNAGVALAERIDSLQRAINMARFNPLKVNMDTMTYGYEVMISSNDGLQNEGWSKFTDTEKQEIKKLGELVHLFCKNFPPLTIKNNKEVIVNKNNYEQLIKLLDFYEKKNKEFFDNHDLNSPSKDEEDDDYDY